MFELDESVTLAGLMSDLQHADNQIHFRDDGSVKRPYQGKTQPPPSEDADFKGQDASIVRGTSCEAVAIVKRPYQQLLRQDLKKMVRLCHPNSGSGPHSFLYVPRSREGCERGYQRNRLQAYQPEYSIDIHNQSCPQGNFDSGRRLSDVCHAYLHRLVLFGFRREPKKRQSGYHGLVLDERWRFDFGRALSGVKSIISGPAGGVIGMALTVFNKEEGRPVLRLDIGGTSTDVSRFVEKYEQIFETSISDITIQSPQLDINTVASAGSSRLFPQ